MVVPTRMVVVEMDGDEPVWKRNDGGRNGSTG